MTCNCLIRQNHRTHLLQIQIEPLTHWKIIFNLFRASNAIRSDHQFKRNNLIRVSSINYLKIASVDYFSRLNASVVCISNTSNNLSQIASKLDQLKESFGFHLKSAIVKHIVIDASSWPFALDISEEASN